MALDTNEEILEFYRRMREDEAIWDKRWKKYGVPGMGARFSVISAQDGDPIWFHNYYWMMASDPWPSYGDILAVTQLFDPTIHRWLDGHIAAENERSKEICRCVLKWILYVCEPAELAGKVWLKTLRLRLGNATGLVYTPRESGSRRGTTD